MIGIQTPHTLVQTLTNSVLFTWSHNAYVANAKVNVEKRSRLANG